MLNIVTAENYSVYNLIDKVMKKKLKFKSFLFGNKKTSQKSERYEVIKNDANINNVSEDNTSENVIDFSTPKVNIEEIENEAFSNTFK